MNKNVQTFIYNIYINKYYKNIFMIFYIKSNQINKFISNLQNPNPYYHRHRYDLMFFAYIYLNIYKFY